jgi:hypothetical protein
LAYAEELLQLARNLAQENNQSQTALRRAMSTAYYALFHLLVSEASASWLRVELRPELGRLFQHGRMKDPSKQLKEKTEKLMKDGNQEGEQYLLTGALFLLRGHLLRLNNTGKTQTTIFEKPGLNQRFWTKFRM